MVGNTQKYTTTAKQSSSLSATSTNTTTSSLLPPPQTQNMPYYLRRHKELTSNNSSTLSVLNVNTLLLMPNSNTSTTTTTTNGKHLSKIPQYCSSQSSAASSPSPSPSSSSSSCSLQNELIHHHLQQQMKSTNNNKSNNKKVTTGTASAASKAAMVQLSFETNVNNKKHAQLNETSFNNNANKKLMKKKRTSTVTNVNVNAIIKKSNNSSYLMSCTTSRSGSSSSSNASTSHSNQETSSDCDEDDDEDDDDDDNNNDEKAEENTITTTLLEDGADEINDELNNNNADVNNKNKAVTFSDKITISKCSGTRGGQQQNTTNIAKLNGKASRTPPHKKFRKLRLFDTPHTPKTLIKKSKLAAALNPISDESKSNSTDEATSKIELPPPPPPPPPSSSFTSIKPSSLPVSILRPVSTPVNIVVANEDKKLFIDTSPPHNQLFKTSKLFNEIFENVHHTPKSLRRTPNLAFKLPHDSNVQEMMDVDVCCFQSAKKLSATKSQQQSQLLRQKLFDQNEEQAQSSCSLKMCEATTTTANKILNFDDTDNEEEYLKVTGSHKMSSSECIDDEMRSLFEPVSSSTNLNKMSKKMLGPPSTPSQSSSRSVPPLNSSTSLFRPIQRCGTTTLSSSSTTSGQHYHIHHHVHHQRNNSGSFTGTSSLISSTTSSSSNASLSSTSTNSSSSFQCNNGCQPNSAHNSTCVFNTTSHHINSRSPHSPFQFNQLQANINPFTPTNSYDNSKLTSASNAAAMVKLAVTARCKQQDPNPSVNSSQILSTSLTNRNSGMSAPVKRCFNQTTEASTTTSNSELTNGDSNEETGHHMNQSINDEEYCLNTSSYNKQQENTDTNSLPKNKRLALRQCLVSRYHEEFHEVCKLGSGEFGDVFKCINRLDGCTYAIKRSKKPIAGSALEVAAWKEVCAHAVLVKHNHIVQYYSAWAEADRMLIQNEYCNGGSLAEFIESLKMNNMNCGVTSSSPLSSNNMQSTSDSSNLLMMNEADLKILLMHIAKGLAYMHSLNLVHLDIKPGNIFICRTPRRHHLSAPSTSVATVSNHTSRMIDLASGSNTLINGINEESGIDSDEMDEDDGVTRAIVNHASSANSTKTGENSSRFSLFSEVITYKIGDLGHVTSTLEPHVEEGDCRYLPNEILQEQYDHLQKADVFALALTVFVCGSLEELPKNGDEWHWIRQGNLKDLAQCSDRFKKLLLQMIQENPTQRPSANTLVHHPCICPDATKSKAQLRKELNQEKFKNEMLQRKVKKYEQQINKIDSPVITTSTNRFSVASTLTNSNVNMSTISQHHNTRENNNDMIPSKTYPNKFVRSFSSSTIL